MRLKTLGRVGLVAVLVLFGAQAAFAQMGTGRVSGTVKDPNGNPIEGATITATSGDSNRALEATTDANGRWAILGFRSRAYDFSVQASGFQPYNYQAQIQQAGRNPDMDLVLEPAAMGSSAGTGGGLLAEAQELHQAGMWDEALMKYDEVLAADPTMYQIHLNRGSVLRELGREDDAKMAYQMVLDQDPGSAPALISMAEIAVAANDLDTAVEYFKTAVDTTDDEIIPFNVAAIYFQNGNVDEAIEYFLLAAERRMDWAEPHLEIAKAYLNKGDFASARTHLNMVVEIEPDGASAAMANAMLQALPED